MRRIVDAVALTLLDRHAARQEALRSRIPSRLWLLRMLGVLAALTGLAVILYAQSQGPSMVYFVIDAVTLASLTAGAFGLAIYGRRIHVQEVAGYRDAVMQVLYNTLALRDHGTADHTRRVTDMSVAFASYAGLSSEQLDNLYYTAALHDIGKVVIPDAILNKPTALSEDEWAVMSQHPTFGYQILLQTPQFHEVAEIIYSHHERWDGTGYPRGLSGESIPLEARLFAVIDAYDAMTSNRPYRPAMSAEAAIDELLRGAAAQFDPQVVYMFVSAWRSGVFQVATS